MGVPANLFLVLLLALFSRSNGDDKFVPGVACHKAQDCYINDGSELALACYYNVNKCQCSQTIMSDFHLIFDNANKQCLSSKYGPCGTHPTNGLTVGCADGFSCIDKKCRDPKLKEAKEVYKFPVSSCADCGFSKTLRLECVGHFTPNQECLCREVYIADGKSESWSIRNYDGNHNCSVSQFGPCGTKNGVTIECHGDGMSCVNGLCTNPVKPLSSIGERCQDTSNCNEGLLCSYGYTCIERKTSTRGTACNSDEECVEGMRCKQNPLLGPWNSKRCYGADETFEPRRPDA